MNMCDNGDGKPAVRRGLCWACIKCVARNGSTIRKKPEHGARYPTRERRQLEAALHVAEAEDLKRALDRLRKAVAGKRRKPDTVHKSPEYPRGD
jgi:hypothetical protein